MHVIDEAQWGKLAYVHIFSGTRLLEFEFGYHPPTPIASSGLGQVPSPFYVSVSSSIN